jgi:hypothetical protein
MEYRPFEARSRAFHYLTLLLLSQYELAFFSHVIFVFALHL